MGACLIMVYAAYFLTTRIFNQSFGRRFFCEVHCQTMCVRIKIDFMILASHIFIFSHIFAVIKIFLWVWAWNTLFFAKVNHPHQNFVLSFIQTNLNLCEFYIFEQELKNRKVVRFKLTNLSKYKSRQHFL